jgi:sugar fermentation stimulation protein A
VRLPELVEVLLVRRYKRFLADIQAIAGPEAGRTITVHCPNTGAMTGCADPGSRAWISTSQNPKRKYPQTLEMVQTPAGMVSVNTLRANALGREAIENGVIDRLRDVADIQAEAKIPDNGGRFDLAMTCAAQRVFVEVKSATLYLQDGLGAFPDAVSERAVKHVVALARQVQAGHRGVLIFCSQHCAIERVRPAYEIHPDYADALATAIDAGVEVYALGCRTDLKEFIADRQIEFLLR